MIYPKMARGLFGDPFVKLEIHTATFFIPTCSFSQKLALLEIIF